MPEIVINTGPIIALVAATGSLEWLSQLYTRVWIPQEVEAGQSQATGAGRQSCGLPPADAEKRNLDFRRAASPSARGRG